MWWVGFMDSTTTCVHITGGQAIKLLRAARAKELVTAVPCDISRASTTPDALESLNNLGIDKLLSWLNIGPQNPLEVLVQDAESRIWAACAKTSVLSRDMPPGAFLELANGTGHDRIVFPSDVRVFVDAPPLALVNEARRLGGKLAYADAPRSATMGKDVRRLATQRQAIQRASTPRPPALILPQHPATQCPPSQTRELRTMAPLSYGGACERPSWAADTPVDVLPVAMSTTRSSCPFGESEAAESLERLATLLQLIALASEFCGNYARDPLKPMAEECHYDKPHQCGRFVTPEELNEFLRVAPPMDGIGLARKAAKYAIDESGSPMETLSFLAWTLPPRMAGLSMRKPLVNEQLVIEDRRLREQLDRESLRPDFQWPEFHTLVEYLGDENHASHDARVRDKNRLKNYLAADYKPFFLMFDDVGSVAAFNETALRIARELEKHGKRREVSRVSRIMRSTGFRDRQIKLMSTLLPPVMRYDQ